MSVVVVHDSIHANAASLPPGQAAGYTTGSADIAWTPADWNRHPGAVRICQDAPGSDVTADVYDVERYAGTNARAPGWYRDAEKTYLGGQRPGQRSPVIYTSASNVTPLVNALIAAGVTSGCGLWVANWNLGEPQAQAQVAAAAGPFPVIGVQWASLTAWDVSVFSGSWLARVSARGQYSHETDGTQSLGQIAASRGMRVESWLAEQAGMHPDDGANLAGAAVPPAGMRWWSVHP
jgi:hypothetical protein